VRCASDGQQAPALRTWLVLDFGRRLFDVDAVRREPDGG